MIVTEIRFDDNLPHFISLVISSWRQKYLMDFDVYYDVVYNSSLLKWSEYGITSCIGTGIFYVD